MQDTVRAVGDKGNGLSSLRIFIAVGAPIPRALVKEAQQKLPCHILTGWGQTEDGMVTITLVNIN